MRSFARIVSVVDIHPVDGRDRVGDFQPPPRRLQIDFALAVFHGGGAEHFPRALRHQIFDEVHHRVIVGVGLIQFDHREFGIVRGVDAFVAEIAVDFVHPVQPADQQPLQVRFRGNAEEQVEVEGVVVGGERLGRAAAVNRLEHRGFDFEELAPVEVAADEGDDAAAGDEALPALVVGGEVEVAAAETHFHVFQAAPLGGQRLQAFADDAETGRENRDFAGAAFHQLAVDFEEIADVEEFRGGKVFAAFLQQIALDFPAAVLEVEPHALAHVAHRDRPPGGGDFGRVLHRDFPFRAQRPDFRNHAGDVDAGAVRVFAAFPEFREFVQTFLTDLFVGHLLISRQKTFKCGPDNARR